MGCPERHGCDAHLEAEFEDRVGDIGTDAETEDGEEGDPDMEEWLAARLDDLEERRFALFDREGEW